MWSTSSRPGLAAARNSAARRTPRGRRLSQAGKRAGGLSGRAHAQTSPDCDALQAQRLSKMDMPGLKSDSLSADVVAPAHGSSCASPGGKPGGKEQHALGGNHAQPLERHSGGGGIL